MIRVQSLTKRYGDKVAVDGVDFTVKPGTVTGFLGPNGAGKSTTMRMMVGLDAPTAGTAEVNGRRYDKIQAPMREVGVLLEARSAHRSRTAYRHLLAIAATHRIGRDRVREVMGVTGIEDVADKRVGGFSLGMGQRLGIAAAMLGDPQTIILDEPINGLDPDGILWVRAFLRQLAAEGRTVLLSSHVMGEMAQTADELIVIGRGRVLAQGALDDVVGAHTKQVVRARAREQDRLIQVVLRAGATASPQPDGTVEIDGLSAEQVAEAAAAAGVVLFEVATHRGNLEEAYLALTAGAVEYQASLAAQNGAMR